MNRRMFLARLGQIAGGLALFPLAAQSPDATITDDEIIRLIKERNMWHTGNLDWFVKQ